MRPNLRQLFIAAAFILGCYVVIILSCILASAIH